MRVLRSIVMAFSLYSRIPMPKLEWKDEDMKYCMCAFPLVGTIQGLFAIIIYQLLRYCRAGNVMTAGIMTVFPILFTGGIHMDGLLDTYDALCSYGDKERKLKILKDPHVGGFAVIHAIVYVLLAFVCWNELTEKTSLLGRGFELICSVFAGFIISRILSGISVVRFRKAKDDGMVSDISSAQDKKCFVILLVMLFFVFVPAFIFLRENVVILLISLPVFFYYRYRSYREFGGITGDLAGWFLQLCELAVLLCATLLALFYGLVV